MARRTALPEIAGRDPAPSRCGPCEAKSPFEYRCPTCPDRIGGRGETYDLGWGKAVLLYGRHVVDAMHENAVAARSLSVTHEEHPAFPELLEEYQRTGDSMDRTRRAPKP